MKLNYILALFVFHAEVHGAKRRQKDTHMLWVLILVVLKLHFEAINAYLMVEINEIWKWIMLDFDLRYTCFHEPIQITHLVQLLFDEFFKEVHTFFSDWGYRYFVWHLLLSQSLLVLKHSIVLLVLEFEVIMYFCCHYGIRRYKRLLLSLIFHWVLIINA